MQRRNLTLILFPTIPCAATLTSYGGQVGRHACPPFALVMVVCHGSWFGLRSEFVGYVLPMNHDPRPNQQP
jgi:hypothetical protein